MNFRQRIRNKVIPFNYSPFSKRQLQVLSWWAEPSPFKDWDAIIADGAIRSGKTVSMALSFVLWSMQNFNGQNFAFAGKTIFSCRRNVIQPLKQMLVGRDIELIEVRNENMIILVANRPDPETGKMKEVVNYYYIFGGKDESSQDLIQGITLAGTFFDEVVLMPESFVNQATGRHNVTGSKFWFNCNPSGPFHWFKKEWIDKAQAKNILYLHFTMEDNLSLTEEIKQRYRSLYTGVFYKRFVLGLWVGADGVVYPMFDEEKHVKRYYRNWSRLFIAGDFGINNPTTFGLYGYYKPEKHYHLISSYYHNGRQESADKGLGGYKTTKNYADDLAEFIEQSGFAGQIKYIILDPSASAMSVELQKHPYFKNMIIQNAVNDVMLGIQFHGMLLENEKFTVDPRNENDIEEYGSYVWDVKKADKGEDEVVKENDHCMDRNRYACITDSILNREFTFELESFSGKGIRTA